MGGEGGREGEWGEARSRDLGEGTRGKTDRNKESGGLLSSNALRIVSTDKSSCFINTLIIVSIRRDDRWRLLQSLGEIKSVVMW